MPRAFNDYSIGEIDALVLKAYRATGMPWGLAEEAGRAAAWMAMHRLPGLESFAGLVIAFDGVAVNQRTPVSIKAPYHSTHGSLCPVVMGTVLNDFYAGDTVFEPFVISQCAYPAILLPFIDQIALINRRRLVVSWGDVEVRSNGDGLVIDGDPSSLGVDQTERVQVSTDNVAGPTRKGIARRGQGHPAAIKVLEKFAHRTFVPASDHSRMGGAGAGLTDND
jgi:hypothetical protein